MDSILTIVIIFVSAILLFLLIELVMKSRSHKELVELKSWKQTLKDKPVADELKKVKDLNMTGQTEELFEKWRGEWDEIVAIAIPNVEKQIQDTEQTISGFSFRKSRTEMNQIGVALAEIEEGMEKIVTELQVLLDSYQKNNAEIETVREAYRELKKHILAYHHTFRLVEKKVEHLMDEAKQTFQSFDEATAQGNYLEAREIVKMLEDKISYLQFIMTEVPELEMECITQLPAQIDELVQGYTGMQQQGYILDHLELEREVAEISSSLQSCLDDVQALRIVEAKEGIVRLRKKMDGMYDALEKEVTSKYHAEKEVKSLEDSIVKLHDNTEQTKEETQFVKQSYELDDADIEAQRYVEKQVQLLIKRFHTLQLRIADQDIAFSVICEELDELRQQVEEIERLHVEYTDMLQTLRKEELEARETLKKMRVTMTETKRLIEKSNLPGLPSDTISGVKQAQVAIQGVYELLEHKPLHMPAVNTKLAEAQFLVEGMFEVTKEMIEQANIVEKMIQYGNRYRSQSTHVEEELAYAEKLFRQYQYKAALEQAAAVLEQVEPGVGQKIQEFVRTE